MTSAAEARGIWRSRSIGSRDSDSPSTCICISWCSPSCFVERALGEVDAFWAARQGGVDAAAAATHLRAAVGALDDLIGVVTPDDVLDRVFASFCVGK